MDWGCEGGAALVWYREMRELLQVLSLGGLVICGAFSLWPVRFANRWRSWNLYLPVAGLLFYMLYEGAMPAEDPYRWRWALALSLLLFLWANGVAKVLLLRVLHNRAGGSRRRLRRQPQRLWQLLAALPLLAACGLMWWRMML